MQDLNGDCCLSWSRLKRTSSFFSSPECFSLISFLPLVSDSQRMAQDQQQQSIIRVHDRNADSQAIPHARFHGTGDKEYGPVLRSATLSRCRKYRYLWYCWQLMSNTIQI